MLFKQPYSPAVHLEGARNTLFAVSLKSSSQSAITCLKLTRETLEQGVKYVKSQQ